MQAIPATGHTRLQALAACKRTLFVALSPVEVLLRAQCLRMCRGWHMALIENWLMIVSACFCILCSSEDAMDSSLTHHATMP